jgi:hypothetical protein
VKLLYKFLSKEYLEREKQRFYDKIKRIRDKKIVLEFIDFTTLCYTICEDKIVSENPKKNAIEK